jgi:uncharacterized membrane protein
MPTILRNKYRAHEPVWHAQIAMLLAIVLQLLLPDRFVFGSRYLLISIELILLVAMSFTTPKEKIFKSLSRRINVSLLIILTGIANAYALLQIARKLLESGHINDGRELVLSAVNIFITNIIVFGLLYWEMDGGGPGRRRAIDKSEQDFLFPQNQDENFKHPDWMPTFIDYVYVASTNAMAFSPTDTLPLTRRAKLLMLVQATLSLVTIGLVAARAVNILN